MAAPKKYGLILRKSSKVTTGNQSKMGASNVFGDDSDDEHDKSNIEDMIKKESMRNLSRVQTQLMMQKALQEDANVFEYDNVFDEMKTKKEAQDIANNVVSNDRKPRYIENLLKNAAARKCEDDRRTQRKIQREREEEKDLFGDKESFITAAYKQKLEEMQREEAEAKRREQLEDMMDVTKQQDLSGFYRHLLKQQCGEEKVPDGTIPSKADISGTEVPPGTSKVRSERTSHEKSTVEDSQAKDIASKKSNLTTDENPDADSDFLQTSSSDSEEEDNQGAEKSSIKQQIAKRNGLAGRRTYRRRKEASDDSEGDEAHSSSQKLPTKSTNKLNDDDDDDDSSSESSDSDDDGAQPGGVKNVATKSRTEPEEPSKPKSNDATSKPHEAEPAARKRRAPRDWKELFAKRCVGKKFDEARQRYLERQASRQAICGQG